MSALEQLWTQSLPSEQCFDSSLVCNLPDLVKRYLNHAIAPGTPPASACRIRMHGEIRLGSWRPFSAEEVIVWGTGMIWQASVRMFGLPIRGSDSLINGHGQMRWRLLGVVPFIDAAGPDITRSAAGRVNIESIWLPSMPCLNSVDWSALDSQRIRASFHAHGEDAVIDLTVDNSGAIRRFEMRRWGNPDQGGFRLAPFGGFVDYEGQFEGYRVPKQMRIGWFPLAEGFAQNGEFFRVTVDGIEYRS